MKTGSLLLAVLAASAFSALAGDNLSVTANDKNPVIEKPKVAPRFYVDLLAGGEFDTGVTDFVGEGSANLRTFRGGLPTPIVGGVVNDAILVVPLLARLQARDFSETHSPVINARLELGYKILPYLSIFAGFTYSHADGNDRANIGTVIDVQRTLAVNGGPNRFNLFAGVGQYQAFAGRAGFKLNTPRTLLDLLHIPKAIKPYASFSAGGKYLSSQYVRFYTDAQSIGSIVDTGRFKLYDESWVFSVEGNLGYDLQLTRNLDIVLESGYGYDTRPDDGGGREGVARGGYTGVSTKGSRVYSTVSLGAKFSF